MSRLSPIPAPAIWLGASGLVPFLAAAIAAWIGSPWVGEFAVRLAVTYGAVILSFLGGIFWGFAATPTQADVAGADPAGRPPAPRHLFAFSILPSFIAWIAVLLAPQTAVFLLICAFVAILWLDYASWKTGVAPSWWMELRVPLSAVVVVCLLAIALSPQG